MDLSAVDRHAASLTDRPRLTEVYEVACLLKAVSLTDLTTLGGKFLFECYKGEISISILYQLICA